MNVKYISMFIVASAGAFAFGCGDSSGTGGAGGTGTTTGSTTGATTSSSKSSSAATTGSTTTGTGTASTGTGMSCSQTCIANHQAGYMVLAAQVINECGCKQGAPCATDCSSTTACADPPQAPAGACDTCLVMESNKGTSSACSLAAAGSPACTADTDCSALVTCIIGCGG